MNGRKIIYNQNNFNVVETRKKFRPWEDHTEQNENSARPSLVELPPLPTYLNYLPQAVERPKPCWNWYLPYCSLVAAHPVTAVWPGGAMAVSGKTTEDTSPTLEAMVPQESQSRRKRKREEETEDEEIRLKAKRDEHLMKIIAKLSPEQMMQLYPYQGEMARKYAPKERTPAEQRRRDKNTEACRRSRRRNKLMTILKECQGDFEM